MISFASGKTILDAVWTAGENGVNAERPVRK